MSKDDSMQTPENATPITVLADMAERALADVDAVAAREGDLEDVPLDEVLDSRWEAVEVLRAALPWLRARATVESEASA